MFFNLQYLSLATLFLILLVPPIFASYDSQKADSFRGKDFEITTTQNSDGITSGSAVLGLPEWLKDNQGKFVSHLVYNDPTAVTFESGQTSFVYDKESCAITIFEKGRISPNSNPLIKSQSWSVHYAEIDTDEWHELEHSSLPCETKISENVDEHIIEGQRINENGTFTVIYKKPINKPLETIVKYTNADPAKDNHKFGFTETLNQLPDFDFIQKEIFHSSSNVDLTQSTAGEMTIDIPHEEFPEKELVLQRDGKAGLNYNFKMTEDLFWNARLQKIDDRLDLYVDFKNLPEEKLAIGQTTSLDPLYGYVPGVMLGITTDNGASTDCGNGAGTSFSSIISKQSSSLAFPPSCQGVGATFDISPIPDSAQIGEIKLEVTIIPFVIDGINCDVNPLSQSPFLYESNLDFVGFWNDVNSGPSYIDDDSFCTNIGTDTLTLAPNAQTDLQNNLGVNEFNIGFIFDDMTRDGITHTIDSIDSIQLQVGWTELGGPTITSTPVLTAIEDSPYSYDVEASDPDPMEVFEFSLDVSPSGMTIDSSTGVILWTPDNSHVGPNSVTVRVEDAGGLFDTQSYTISVSNTNDPPMITSSHIPSVLEDSLYTYDVEFTDVDVGDTHTFSLPVMPSWITDISPTGVISGTPDNDDVDNHPVTARVEDAGGLSDTQSFSIEVINTNDEPVADPQSISTPEDNSIAITLSGSDVDGDTLLFSITNPPSFGMLSGAAPNLTYQPNQDFFGADSFEFEVDDGNGGTSNAIVNINVLPVNDLGDVFWIDGCYIRGTGIVRVIDPDLNLDSLAIDNFNVRVWSESDAVGIALRVTETQVASGIFEGLVDFTDFSSGNRLHVEEGDIITAEYEENTPPQPSLVPSIKITAIQWPTNSEADVSVSITQSPPGMTVSTGQPVTYSITIHNDGPDTAEEDVFFSFDISPEANQLSMSLGSCTFNGCLAGELAPGGNSFWEFVLSYDSFGIYENTFGGHSGPTCDPNQGNNKVTVSTFVNRAGIVRP